MYLAHHELESILIIIIIIFSIIVVQGYYDEDMDSEMTESQADEEVAVTKRGRAVKMPAKYKAEVRPLQHTGFLGKMLLWHHVVAFWKGTCIMS